MQIENIDIYDDNMKSIGFAERSDVHKYGYWHETFHCWVVQEDNLGQYILFQKRNENKQTFPNKFDITAAGHLMHGEGIPDGIRELEEEIGMNTSFEELIPVGTYKQVLKGDNFIDSEISNIFLYECNNPIDTFKLQRSELSGIVRINIEDAIKLFSNEIDAIYVSDFVIYDDLKIVDTLILGREDFVPHSEEYYSYVLNFAQKYLMGKLLSENM
jgi:isopentenyldiphosphate isomerase